ncbi:MAG: histidinol-phosphatase [Oscillospiraceae bacterium]|nr:histidinol-phosphatase [Oscillospiraceae bacterium]
MRANYHSHTVRCGHARGTEREYIESALAAGMEELGFSDHAPFRLPGLYPGIRMAPEELGEYVSVLRSLRREYAGRIQIHIGLEAEYYPAGFPGLLDDARREGVEYLILGQHFPGNEAGEVYFADAFDEPRRLDRYVGQSIEAMQSGVFSYFAHPDLAHFTGDEALYRDAARRLCRCASDCALPLEINLLGLRLGRNYPDERFWRVAGEEGCAAVLGCDAHDPEGLRVPEAERAAMAMAERCSLRVLDRVSLRPLVAEGGGL